MLVRLAISDPRGVGWTLGDLSKTNTIPFAVPMSAMADTSVCAICQQDDVDEEWEYLACCHRFHRGCMESYCQIENMTSIQDVKNKVKELKKAEVLLCLLLRACRRR